jgi:hypothetical protein
VRIVVSAGPKLAPDGGDGSVDLLDLARLCEEWLQKEDWYQGP